MENITIMTLQERLRKMSRISVPLIQQEFSLTYKEAKAFLEELLARGWVKKEPEGNCYPVMKDKLRLRRIERSEVDTLIEDTNMNCVAMLLHIQKEKSAAYEDLADVVDNENDALETVGLLTKNRLIYLYDNAYFLCVSPKVVKVLSEVARAKRSWDLGRRITGKETTRGNIRHLFDSLF